MSSESISKQTLARIKAEYLASYEIEMDDWSAIILLDNQHSFKTWITNSGPSSMKTKS